MRKKILFVLILIMLFSFTSCNKKETPKGNEIKPNNENVSVEEKAAFTIVCDAEAEKSGTKITEKATYNFNSEQKVINYERNVVAIFNDEKKYNDSKSEEMKNEINEKNNAYLVTFDDNTKTLTINNKVIMEKVETNVTEETNTASYILENSEKAGGHCVVDGLDRSQIK